MYPFVVTIKLHKYIRSSKKFSMTNGFYMAVQKNNKKQNMSERSDVVKYFFNMRREIPFLQGAMQCSLFYIKAPVINQTKML